MSLVVAVGLRPEKNKTNVRAEAVAIGLEKAGARIICIDRGEPLPTEADIYLQTGMGRTRPILDAIRQGTPYLIAEAPFYRIGVDVEQNSSWGWNGMAGGAFYGELPITRSQSNINPELQPIREEGPTYIIGQKPTDHSLRGSNHEQWLQQKLKQFPDAVFRPHPLMYQFNKESNEEVLSKAGRVVTYTSTFGAEAAIHGAKVIAEHWGSSAWDYATGKQSREEWAQDLAWKHGSHEWLARRSTGKVILSAYEEAHHRMLQGCYEVPRDKMQPVAEYSRDVLGRAL